MSNRILLNPSRRSLLAIAGASFALSACDVSKLIGPPDALQIYVLRPTLGELGGPKVAWALAVDRPEAADNLDISRIAISRSANTQDYFANAAWADKLPNLVQSAIVDAFEKSGRIDQVASDTEGVRTNYLLQTEIREFEARYDQPDGAPTVVVRIAARLVARDGHTIVARIVSERKTPATQNSIDAAVMAFDRALGDVTTQIANWALGAPPPKESKARR
jgi:cholesterol transport system auxiliary component